MKTCPTCGTRADDRFLYCPDDGSVLDLPRKDATPSTPDGPAPDPVPKVALLFCPACEGEYPLTFSSCPIDGLRLTKGRARYGAPNAAPVTVAAPPPTSSQPDIVRVETIDSPPKVASTAHYESADEALEETEVDLEQIGFIKRIRSDRPSFQVAAIATLIGLALFGLASAYRLYSLGIKRPSIQSPVETSEDRKESQPAFFIETPREAREYVEEAAGQDRAGAAISEQDDRAPEGEQPGRAQPTPIKPPVERASKPQSQLPAGRGGPRDVSSPVKPESTGGHVEAKLVRVRASRTRPGYRYDLTFTLRERAGRPVRWDRLVVSARSSSGANHLQTLPFNHMLRPSGLLTFTVSVEMPGRKEPDWRGRIVCTTAGTDSAGRALRASFGANVSP